jgi:hypothetical protein
MVTFEERKPQCWVVLGTVRHGRVKWNPDIERYIFLPDSRYLRASELREIIEFMDKQQALAECGKVRCSECDKLFDYSLTVGGGFDGPITCKPCFGL